MTLGNVMMETASIPEVIPELPEGTSTQDLSAVDTAQAVLPPIGGKLIHEEASSMQPQMAADVVDSAAAADVGASQEAAEAALSQLDSDLELASANPQGEKNAQLDYVSSEPTQWVPTVLTNGDHDDDLGNDPGNVDVSNRYGGVPTAILSGIQDKNALKMSKSGKIKKAIRFDAVEMIY